MTRIKICGITRVQDVQLVVKHGADALGMVFYAHSPRNVSVPQAAKLVAATPPFITTVGLFVNPLADEVRDVLRHVPLSVLQFHGEEDAEFCAQFGLPYLKAIRVKPEIDLLQCASLYQGSKTHQGAQGLLLDAFVEGTHGGTGRSFDWNLIPRNLPLPVILSGGLNVDNVAQAIQQVRPYAVDISSGVELSPKELNRGIKDGAKVAAFINEVKRIDLQLS